jgi:polyvinyl alcohol dehydrogenase (cytochrome)
MGPSGSSNASAVVYKGLLFAGFSETGGEIAAPEGGGNYRGGYAVVDVRTGEVLVNRYVISDKDNKKGYGGAGIWSTAVVSRKTGYLYVGAGNPFGRKEHELSNSILKIDMNRKRRTFGDIVGFQHGNPDQYQAALTPLGDLPTCTATNLPTTFEHPECGQIDLDFGAAPNLFNDSKGREIVGTLQKSGMYHAVYTKNMKEAWSAMVGQPCASCNADATAFDGEKVYAVGAPGGVLVAINKDDGSIAWRSPVVDGTHYQAVSVANGVVYTMDTKGNLDTFDAVGGLPIFSRPMAADSGGAFCSSLSGGVAIAEGHIFAPCGGTLITYGWDAEG